jgi:hypothetical protein
MLRKISCVCLYENEKQYTETSQNARRHISHTEIVIVTGVVTWNLQIKQGVGEQILSAWFDPAGGSNLRAKETEYGDFIFLVKCYWGYYVKGDEVGGVCRTHETN